MRPWDEYYWNEDKNMSMKIADDPDLHAYCKYMSKRSSSVGPNWDKAADKCVFPPTPTPREKCNATPGFHWEGDDATGSCVPDTDPEATTLGRDEGRRRGRWDGTNCTKKLTPISTKPRTFVTATMLRSDSSIVTTRGNANAGASLHTPSPET